MTLLAIAAALFVCAFALWKPFPRSKGRLRAAAALALLGAAALPLRLGGSDATSAALLELAGLQLAAGILFAVLSHRVALPRFKVEVVVVAGYALILFHLLYSLGVNVTGIFATSAVATAVIGLALQDMLSNIAGGLALEFEGEIRVGQFIRCADASGWVQHVRLRHTAIDTADGERVILPNSYLVRSPVTVAARPRRIFIPFALPYERNPQDVTEAAGRAISASPIPGIATDPAPHCIVRELAAGQIQYAAVVWILEPGRESPAISAVLTRLWFGLRRAGVPLAEISQLLELKQPGAAAADISNPTAVIRATPIFRLLDDSGIAELAAQLRSVPFAPGEFVLRQGEPGDSMYFVVAGEAAITFTGSDNQERRVSVVAAGDFFGEATLLTGAPRTANAIALTRLECYELHKSGLQGLMKRQPELAEDMAVVITLRETQLAAVREEIDREFAVRRQAEHQSQLLERIRHFFSLED